MVVSSGCSYFPVNPHDQIMSKIPKKSADHPAKHPVRQNQSAAEALRISELRYRRLFESAQDGILILDAETGAVDDVNPYMIQMLGYTKETFLNRKIWELGFFRDIVANQENFVELQQNEYIRYADKPLETASGDRIEVEFVSNVYLVAGRKVIQCNIRDITARKRAEARQHASEKSFRDLADAMPQLIWITGTDGLHRYFNQKWVDFTGRSLAENNGSGWDAPFDPEDRVRLQHAWLQAVRDGAPYSLEVRLRRADGVRRWCLIRGVPQYDPAGQIFQWVGTGTDIEEIKQAELLVKQSEAALRISLHEVEFLLKDVHHRVKNNLQVISSMMRLEVGRTKEPDVQIALTEMQGRIRAMALLHELLYRTGNFSSVNLASYLMEVAAKLFRSQNAYPGTVRLVEELTPVEVSIDQGIVCGLFMNELLTNSLKHAFPGGRVGKVLISLQPVPGSNSTQWRLAVSDNGIGLPAELEIEKSDSLGLKLVSDLARQLQGRFEIGPGPGATFAVEFSVPPEHEGPDRRDPDAHPPGA